MCSETPFIKFPVNIVGKMCPETYGFENEETTKPHDLGFRRIKCDYIDKAYEQLSHFIIDY